MAPDQLSVAYVKARLEILLSDVRRVLARRQAAESQAVSDPYFGLYVSRQEVEKLLAASAEPPAITAEMAGRIPLLDAVAAEFEQGDVPTVRALRMAEEFGLDRLDTDLIFIAMAADIDARFERFYGFLNDDVSMRRPTVGLAFELCGIDPTEAESRARFSPHSALVEGALLRVQDDGDRPFLSRAMIVPDRVTAYLLGDDRPDAALAGVLVPEPVGDGLDHERLEAFLARGRPLVYIREKAGSDGMAMAVASLDAAGRSRLVVDLRRVKADSLNAVALVAGRECRLTNATLVAGPLESLSEQGAAAVRAFSDQNCATVLAGRRGWDPEWSSRVPLLLDTQPLDHAARSARWRTALGGSGMGIDWDPASVTAQFELATPQIARAAQAASVAARYWGEGMTPAVVRAGARSQNAAGLERLARRVEPTVTWEDLVLPEGPMNALRELAARARSRDKVIGEWGMRPGAGRGRGIAGLFAGDSGTGKTMSAEVVARDLGLDLYVVNLATVVDKYVGETEKNLERIFGEADGVNGVLLFDEADALFGKRSEVRDARDRYANIEVAYLLQRMESFDGLALLSTNLRANVDEAFARRLDAVVDFPMPDPAYRRALWHRCLGEVAPRSDDLDLAFCAEAFKLSGGNIRSITLSAAYRAADAGREITMEDLILGTIGEYKKLGRLCDPSEFGPYYALVTW